MSETHMQQTLTDSAPDWPRAHGPTLGGAVLREQPEDFVVDEHIEHQAEGDGEHLWLRVEKRGANTEWVARRLAAWAGVPARAVSYAGMKDRHAVTRQTFSIHLPGQPDPPPPTQPFSDFRILAQSRAARKLQRGALSGNRFEICLRQCELPAAVLDQRLAAIRRRGVPNYFGEQRFGRDHDNVQRAVDWLVAGGRAPRQRHKQALYFSALRSYLFNQLLAERVQQETWDRILPGERVVLAGSRSWFDADDADLATLASRCAAFDIHPSGPLPGVADSTPGGVAGALEVQVLAPYAAWVSALVERKVAAQRRPLRLIPDDLDWRQTARGPQLCFRLPAGAYATVVLREIVDYQVAQPSAADAGQP